MSFTIVPHPMPALLPDGYQHSIPLTPSPTSPFRAHRIHHQSAKARPKPYHRSASEFQGHVQPILTAGSGIQSPFSPFTPTSLSSSSSSLSSVLSSQFSKSYSDLAGIVHIRDSAEPSSQHLSIPQPRFLQRADSAPVAHLSLDEETFCSYQPSASLQLPIFAPVTEQHQAQSSPLVFSAEYIEAHLAKHPTDAYAPSQQKSVGTLPSSINYGVESQDADIVSTLISQLDNDPVYRDISQCATFPYASAYVSTAAQYQAQLAAKHRQQYQQRSTPSSKGHGGDDVRLDEARLHEDRKQKYAGDLIEAAIKTIHKIWPETQDTDTTAAPGLVTSDGRLRHAVSSSSLSTSKTRPRRKPNQQQVTPDSSPDTDKGRKRKRAESGGLVVKQEMDEASAYQALKRRCCGEPESKSGVNIAHLPSLRDIKPSHLASSSATAPQITLRIFVRELLRRSKTSCNTLEVALCYLDGIEETVKRIRDCLKLGITFGTAAMAERGPYDEGMKDEGRIVSWSEWQKQQLTPLPEIDVRGDWETLQAEPWTPLSPVSDTAAPESKNGKLNQPSSQVLATHPLLDARRTFLASLVLATKFIQDKAYSNKAWAKLSGLGSKEVGRCERALGGALQWRLWVGKDIGKSSIRGRSPIAEEGESLCSGDSESSIVHGDDDELAKSFMAQVVEVEEKARLKTAAGGEVRTAALPAPELAQLQAAADLQQAARAGFGRARTWPALDFGTAAASAASSSFIPQASDLYTSFQQASASHQLTAQLAALANATTSGEVRPPMDVGLSADHGVLGSFGSLGTSILEHSHISASPLPLQTNADEEFFESVLRTECPTAGCPTVITTPATIRMSVDDPSELLTLPTPSLSMVGTFSQTDISPLACFADSWSLSTSFPFTFSVAPPTTLTSTAPSQRSQQGLWRSRSLGNLQQQQRQLPFRVSHPQLTMLRASGGSVASLSPNTASTFSSPEVLTPVHSRASTLVDPMDYGDAWRSSVSTCSGQEVQQCTDKLYSTFIDTSYPALQTA